MKTRNLFSLTPLAFAVISLTACEQTLPYDTYEDDELITVNAIAVTDTSFTAAITRAYNLSLISENWDYTVTLDSGEWGDLIMGSNDRRMRYEAVVIKTAEVELTVNGTDTYTMEYDDNHLNYRSSYVPKPGDELMLKVEQTTETIVDGITVDVKIPDTEATAVVPQTPSFDIVEYNTYTDSKYDLQYVEDGALYPVVGTGEYMDVTIRINDPSGKNFYRLLARSSSENPSYELDLLGKYANDSFVSDDLIFVDKTLTKPYGGWPQYFSNVFDDNLFDCSSYTVTLREIPRLGEGYNPVAIILQSISEDTYYYLKSVQRARIKDNSGLGESLYMYTNFNTGWGILGALSENRQTLAFPE